MSDDLNRKIKSILESSDLKSILGYEISTDLKNINHCCSNNTFVFIYLEEKSLFIAININKLAKSLESFEKSVQFLNLTAAPIGHVKKVTINQNGTHILLVYDKSLSAVELPLKWGKFDEYEGGNKNILCKTIQFHFKHLNYIIDAAWHTQPDDDFIVCLSNNSNNPIIQFFSILNSNISIKSFNLSSNSCHFYLNTQSTNKTTLKSLNDSKAGNITDNDSFISIEIGTKFEYNDKLAYPIFLLKSNGQVNCLIEYENSMDFENLGSLKFEPFSADSDEQQVISFLCVGSQPNCIVLLLKNGQIYHCLFIPTANMNLEITKDYQENDDADIEASLFTYEIIEIDSNELNGDLTLVKDNSDQFRYHIYHKAGVHSIYIPWLEEAKLSYFNLERFDPDDYNESKLSEISNLICTKPIENIGDKSAINGLTLLNGYGTRTMLFALTNELRFICAYVYKSEQFDVSATMSDSRLNASTSSNIDPERFSNYIKSILKRDVTIPVIRSNNSSITHKDNNEFITKIINSLKSEYLEKQKKAFNEIYEKAKSLKQQNKTEEEKIKEITSNIEDINKQKENLLIKYKQINEKQNRLIKCYEELSEKLLKQMSTATENERIMQKQLIEMQPYIKKFDRQIKGTKELLDAKEPNVRDIDQSGDRYKEDELKQIKELINSENDKLKDLMQKVEKLRIAVKI